jgi:hypothetical protein
LGVTESFGFSANGMRAHLLMMLVAKANHHMASAKVPPSTGDAMLSQTNMHISVGTREFCTHFHTLLLI